MSKMLEAIKQIEARGPQAAQSTARQVPKRRTSSPATSAMPPIEDAVSEPAPVEVPVIEEQALPVAERSFTPPPVPVGPSAPAFASRAETLHRGRPLEQMKRVAASLMGNFPALSSTVLALATVDSSQDASRLAALLAEALLAGPKHEVLVVDGRPPERHTSAATYWDDEQGLYDIACRRARWHQAVRPAGLQGLSTLVAGTTHAGQPTAEQWASLWADLKRRFKFIVVDGGSAEAAAHSGLAAGVDATFLVFELDRTSRAAAEHATSRLRRAGARLLGSLILDPAMGG